MAKLFLRISAKSEGVLAQNETFSAKFQNMEKKSHLEQMAEKRLRKVGKGVFVHSSPLPETNP
jgi:hypothetical protein